MKRIKCDFGVSISIFEKILQEKELNVKLSLTPSVYPLNEVAEILKRAQQRTNNPFRFKLLSKKVRHEI